MKKYFAGFWVGFVIAGFVAWITYAIWFAPPVDILVWDGEGNSACHWMPEFGNEAICQAYTVEDGYVSWDELSFIAVSETKMHAQLDFEKKNGANVPDIMSMPTKPSWFGKFLSFLVGAAIVYCLFNWGRKKLARRYRFS